MNESCIAVTFASMIISRDCQGYKTNIYTFVDNVYMSGTVICSNLLVSSRNKNSCHLLQVLIMKYHHSAQKLAIIIFNKKKPDLTGLLQHTNILTELIDFSLVGIVTRNTLKQAFLNFIILRTCKCSPVALIWYIVY